MFSRLLQRVSRLLPSQCAVCHAWPSQPVCEDCITRFAQPEPRCQTCALPVAAGVRQCGQCVKAPPPLDACVAAVSYAYPWSALITSYKFHSNPGWATQFAILLRSMPGADTALDNAQLLLPLPLSPQRLQIRGFNQALTLARALDSTLTDATLLLRIKDTPAQSALGREARLASLTGAFAVEPLQAARLRGKRVVLVDDVMTTGASLFEAARTLRAAGAAHISAVVIARTAD